MSFVPKLEALPAAQRALWPELRQVPARFVLYGGTALALRLGHRQSEDFDFFANAPVDPGGLLRSLPLLAGATIRQEAPNTLTVAVRRPEAVKLSFFGLSIGRVAEPERTDDGTLSVASLLDLAACKMAVLPQRAEAKDYWDVHALIQDGVSLAESLGAAQATYGEQFNPLVTLKALSYFGDGDLPALPARVQQELRQAAASVREIPEFRRLPGGVSPGGQ